MVLFEAQFVWILPLFPLSHGIPPVDAHRVISGIIFVPRNGLRWRDVPTTYWLHGQLIVVLSSEVRWACSRGFRGIGQRQ